MYLVHIHFESSHESWTFSYDFHLNSVTYLTESDLRLT